MSRTRSKSVVENNGGFCSGEATDVISCNRNDCPGKVVFMRTFILNRSEITIGSLADTANRI